MELTKEYFDEQNRLTKEYFYESLDKKLDEKLDQKLDEKLDEKLANFATKDDLKAFATKADLNDQTKELKKFAVDQTEELAQIIGRSFVEHHDYLETKFTKLEDKLDIRERVQAMEYKFLKLEDSLNIKL